MYYKQVGACSNVCPKRGYHMRLSATNRVSFIADRTSYAEQDSELRPVHPLSFVDSASYRKGISDSEYKTGKRSSVISGEACIGFIPVQLVVFDFSFMGASLSSVEGAKITRAVNLAIKRSQAAYNS